MSEPSLIYCDESGNDGPNYLNEQAPFYVLAGWIVPENKITDASVEMVSLLKAHCPDAPELKFKTFKKKPWAVSGALCRLGELGLVPAYLLAEKRYCVAAKIVETFLDPMFNPALRPEFTLDPITKQELANSLYEKLDDATMRQFAEAYRAPTNANMDQALNRVSAESSRCLNPEIAELFEGCRANLAAIAAAEVGACELWGKAMATLNLPCLISFLMLIEELGRQRSIRPKKVVHDEQGPYQDDYKRVFAHYKNIGVDEQLLLNGMRVPYGSIRTIEQFEMQRSVDQPMLQAADLLAGSIAHLSTALIRGEKLKPQEVDLGSLIFPAMLIKDLPLTFSMCSDRMLKKIGASITEAFPKNCSVGEKIDGDFKNYQWSSTVKGSEPSPLLPAPPSVRSEPNVPTIKVCVDLPLYCIAGETNPFETVPVKFATSVQDCLAIWTRRQSADDFLKTEDWTANCHVVKIDVGNLTGFIEHLRASAASMKMVVFNVTDELVPYPMIRLADEMERVLDRHDRAVKTGISRVLYNEHLINGQEVESLLCSTGEYIAMRKSDNLRATGKTREEALSKLTTEMKDRMS